jgi:Flp pilus assembly protein TadG
MGIIEFGRVFYFQQVMTNAAREGARAAATGFESYITAADRVLDPAGIPSPPTATSCDSEGNPSTPASGQTTICLQTIQIPVGSTTTVARRVGISYNVAYITPLGDLLDMLVGGESGFASGVVLTAKAVMRE